MADAPIGPNGGPAHLDSPYATPIPVEQLRQQIDRRVGDIGRITRNDVAFQSPSDPLRNIAARSDLVYRDIPLVAIQNSWTVDQTRAALAAHITGAFDASGQLVDSIMADDRVTATVNSRLAGLFSKELRFRPANDSSAAREVCDAWIKSWPRLMSGGQLKQIAAYQYLFGFWPSQIVWDDTGPIIEPMLRAWHARYTYYQWDVRKFVAITQDGPKPIMPGDGKWFLHAPRGEYRAWMFGAIRAVAEPWLLRHFAMRDMARFSEVYGSPIRKAMVPAAADEVQRDRFQQQLSQLGNETTIMLPVSVDGQAGYDLQLVEATAGAWQIFPGLVDRCDMNIVLAILMQNLTTEVTGGSFSATQAHMDIRQSGIEEDNESFKLEIHDQIARPYALLNFGDPDLAPWTDWTVEPLENFDSRATRFYSFGQAIQILRQGGVAFDNAAELRNFAKSQFNVDLPRSTAIVDPDAGSGSGAASEAAQAAHKELTGNAPKVAVEVLPDTQIALTSTDIATIITVNEGRQSQGLPPLDGPDGDLTITEFKNKNAALIADVADAENGKINP